jgi:hypothetical protein
MLVDCSRKQKRQMHKLSRRAERLLVIHTDLAGIQYLDMSCQELQA